MAENLPAIPSALEVQVKNANNDLNPVSNALRTTKIKKHVKEIEDFLTCFFVLLQVS
jgi:hypothetical protein